LRRDSLVSTTPTRLSLNDAHTRNYHQFENEYTQTTEYASPLANQNQQSEVAAAVVEEKKEEVTPVSTKQVKEVAAAASTSAAAAVKESKTKESPAPVHSVDSVLEYAFDLVAKKFTPNEIGSGIFGDDKNQTKSKTQMPFSVEKTNQFKSINLNDGLL